MERRVGRARAALVAVLAGGMLLAGCGAGDHGGDGASKADRKGGNPAPAPPPLGPSSAPQDGEQRREPAAPDYLSTFALDVDTASYGYARRTLAEGRLPDPADVRPEEFVNSFRQDYPAPDGDGFSVTVDGARTDREGWSLVRVGLATRPESAPGERPPAALTFVIDVSGSMAEPGRLDLVRESLGLMTDRLRADDRIALVTFSDSARTVLPMTRLGDSRGRVHELIDGLEAGASTDVGAGVTTGYDEAVRGRVAGATNRVVLLSDALANTGDTDADGILSRIADVRREHGITLFGVGVGSDYGDAFMERLTNKGDGHTTYVSDLTEARKVFCEDLPAHVELRARDAKAQVAFDRDTVRSFQLIGYENREVADEDYRDDTVDGGEVGPGHTVTALYAVRLREGASGTVATAGVRWLDPVTREPRERTGDVTASALRTPLWDGASPRLQLTAVAAYFADRLRLRLGENPLPATPELPELAERAEQLAERTEDPAARDLATAIRQATTLSD
ncbi:von Willebrand factor type A domain-containing protein [Streptomyces sp. NPDC060194]|uniref:vWA domain-containing protein n=1 Tax=Streptomyces sp. NPDC060194 TaxID=3347069 RepID=UPI003658C3FF